MMNAEACWQAKKWRESQYYPLMRTYERVLRGSRLEAAHEYLHYLAYRINGIAKGVPVS